jgi:chaperonin GroEL (HSP60 family)
MEKIAKATAGKIVSNLNELTPFEIGNADTVEEVKHGEDTLTYIRGCRNPKALTILIHGGSEHVIDEVKRAIKDGLGDVSCALQSGLIVPGGGAIETELARRLREFSQGLSGREQLAVEEFASALEFIPITLAENAGLDPIDTLTELKSRHDSGEKNTGLNLFTNRIENVLEARIIEPLKIKSQAINSASDVSIMILRIDDVISAQGKESAGMGLGQGIGKRDYEEL